MPLEPICALVVTFRMATPTPPATPTNPPPIATARPNRFSYEDASTATPWNEPIVPKPSPANWPLKTPAMPVPPPVFAVMELLSPMNDSVSFLPYVTAMPTPTPTNPPATPPATTIRRVLSPDETRTLLPATTMSLWPMSAKVWVFSTTTDSAPATPTVPPPPANTTDTIVSVPFASTTTSLAAFTVVELSM